MRRPSRPDGKEFDAEFEDIVLESYRWGVYGRGPEKEKKKRLAEGVGKRENGPAEGGPPEGQPRCVF